ncbi:DUF2802 domain-containing protein [Marinobacter zhejiangensis]|uniref:DUF2802 domain-containing protein n=1 Tax=Marinobacter zhejiangensis TaxID=488535 RepID=A0A1I4NQ42_9GAMM|nr:DUF2802 domain-containing protein [Marinobacter zhejiangensis]SFM17652.1 Protein of unknown function [Marinobacter zhejiangensis]
MTEQWTTLAPWLFAATVLVLLVVQTFISQRQIRQLRGQLKERCDSLGRELHAIGSGNVGMGARVVASEQKLHELSAMVEEMRQNDPLRISYDEAARLVELGADIDDLMNTCGISRPEAELVSALRRKQVA